MALMFCDLFMKFLRHNVTVAVVTAAVLAARLLLKKFPKKFSYALWGIVALRMIFSFNLPSELSIFNVFTYVEQESVRSEDGWPQPASAAGENTVADHALTDNAAAGNMTGATGNVQKPGKAASNVHALSAPFQRMVIALCMLWMTGVFVFLMGGAASYVRCKRITKFAVKLHENIWECDGISSPFVLGFLKPRIYIPFHIPAGEYEYIVAHEKYHIRRKDTVIKLLAFFLRAVYWMNPFAWIAYMCMVRDMEMSCDEAVISELGIDIKRAYSMSLLSFAAGERNLSFSPLAFGESDAAERVKNVLNYRKPKFWGVFAAVTVVLLIGITCLTGQKNRVAEAGVEQEGLPQAKDEVPVWSVEKDLTGDGIVDEAKVYILTGSDAASTQEKQDVSLSDDSAFVYVAVTDGAAGTLLYENRLSRAAGENGQLSLVADGGAWFIMEGTSTGQLGYGNYTAEMISLLNGERKTLRSSGVSFETTPEAYVQTCVNGDTPASRGEAFAAFREEIEGWFQDSILLAAVDTNPDGYSGQEVKLVSDGTAVYSSDDYYDTLRDMEAPEYTVTPFENILGYDGYMVEEYPLIYPYIYYYYDKTGRLLAKTWGFGDNFAVDVDGDGENELISNLVYGDGGQEGIIFKREGDEIYSGDLFDLMDEEYEYLLYSSQFASYIPGEDVVEIFYMVQQGDGYESKTKKYKIDLDKIKFDKADL